MGVTPKGNVIHVRVDDEEKKGWALAAAEDGLKLSEFIRNAVGVYMGECRHGMRSEPQLEKVRLLDAKKILKHHPTCRCTLCSKEGK